MPYTDPEVKKAKSKEYREKNKDILKQKKIEYYLKNKERILQKSKANRKYPGLSHSEVNKLTWQKPGYKEARIEAMTGRTLSEEHKSKIAKSLLGNTRSKGNIRSAESIKKGSETRKANKIPGCWKGKKRSILCPLSAETRKRMSESQKGEKSKNWKGGVTHINKRLRNSGEFKTWREEVFKRDNWTCQKCNVRGGKLHPHHILNFAEHEQLRFDVLNGITLCEKEHKIFHKIYGSEGNTREQLIEFLGVKEIIDVHP